MPHAYTEDQLVEQPAIGLFAELGWTTVSALEETLKWLGPPLAERPRKLLPHMVDETEQSIVIHPTKSKPNVNHCYLL